MYIVAKRSPISATAELLYIKKLSGKLFTTEELSYHRQGSYVTGHKLLVSYCCKKSNAISNAVLMAVFPGESELAGFP